MKNQNKKEIKLLLDNLSIFSQQNREQFSNEKGNLDLVKFNDDPMTKSVVESLKSFGVNSSSDLHKMGFLAAGLVLRF
jgi:hypothetical protein